MVYYRVVEMCKAYDSFFGEGKGWIYCSNGILSYEIALHYALGHDRLYPWNKTWVEAFHMTESEYYSVPDYWWLEKHGYETKELHAITKEYFEKA